MNEVVRLSNYDVRLWRGRLQNHDFLWFATTDLNATASTWPILHNYALTYAICQYSHAAYKGYRPDYDADLNEMKGYALPARNPHASRVRLTHNALDDLTQRTDTVVGPGGRAVTARWNTPKLGYRICLAPATGTTGFEVYVFTWDDYRPPSVFRLGKKGCPMRVAWREIEGPRARIPEADVSPVHPINPRDLTGGERQSVVSYYPTIMPPHLLYLEATLRGEWAVFLGGTGWVHVPKRIVQRWQPRTPLGSEAR